MALLQLPQDPVMAETASRLMAGLVDLGPWAGCRVRLPPANTCLFLAPRSAMRVYPSGTCFAYPFFVVWDDGKVAVAVNDSTLITFSDRIQVAVRYFNITRELKTTTLSE